MAREVVREVQRRLAVVAGADDERRRRNSREVVAPVEGLDRFDAARHDIRRGEHGGLPRLLALELLRVLRDPPGRIELQARHVRSEEHTSELQSLMRISYAVFCLKKKKHII